MLQKQPQGHTQHFSLLHNFPKLISYKILCSTLVSLITTMEKQLQGVKIEIMQDRLDSLESRFEELVNSFAQLTTKQLSKE